MQRRTNTRGTVLFCSHGADNTTICAMMVIGAVIAHNLRNGGVCAQIVYAIMGSARNLRSGDIFTTCMRTFRWGSKQSCLRHHTWSRGFCPYNSNNASCFCPSGLCGASVSKFVFRLVRGWFLLLGHFPRLVHEQGLVRQQENVTPAEASGGETDGAITRISTEREPR